MTACPACGCPARATFAQIQEAVARVRPTATPARQLVGDPSWPSKRTSALVALLLSSALALFGSSLSFWLAHAGAPLAALLYWPAIPVLILFGRGGVFDGAPEWLFNGAAFLALFVAYFGVVHFARYAVRRGRRGV
jgi:hypothetical protein